MITVVKIKQASYFEYDKFFRIITGFRITQYLLHCAPSQSYFNQFYSACFTGVSLVVSTWFFSTLLKVEDMTLMFIGTLFLLGKALTEAFNTSAIYFYLANVFSIVTVLISPLSRSQLSKLVPPDELGKYDLLPT